jgi:hypothetical protein
MASAIVDFSTVDEERFGLPCELEQDIKELAVVDMESFSSQQWRFTSQSTGWRPNADYYSLSVSLDDLDQDYSGDIPYKNMELILAKATDSYKVLFTYGEAKCIKLKQLLKRSTVFNLTDFIDVDLSETPAEGGTECLYHFQSNKAQLCPHARAYQLVKASAKNLSLLNMFDSYNRLKTFSKWSNVKVSKETLALGGFIHTPDDDIADVCECIFCGLTVTNWFDESNPYSRHRKFSKYCPIFNYNVDK